MRTSESAVPLWCTAGVADKELLVGCSGADLPALLSLPARKLRAAVVALHPADDRCRRQFLFEHLAQMLPDHGVAVLRYDRRDMPDGRDVPYQLQVEDLNRARAALEREIGPVATGLWGFSQGAWIALLAAAADPDLAFLVLVGCSAVSPARQMRYGTTRQLRDAGFGPADQAGLGRLRAAWEDHQRGRLPRAQAQQIVDRYASRPWFPLSWVPKVVPDAVIWDDMDFDPARAIGQVRCPILAFYGDDQWVPVADSIRIWRSAVPDATRLTIRALDGTTHHPTLRGRRDIAAISPEYTATLTSWVNQTLSSATVPQSGPGGQLAH